MNTGVHSKRNPHIMKSGTDIECLSPSKDQCLSGDTFAELKLPTPLAEVSGLKHTSFKRDSSSASFTSQVRPPSQFADNIKLPQIQLTFLLQATLD